MSVSRPTDRPLVTFEQAAESYLLQGGEGRYLPKIIEYFRGRPVESIHPADVREMAMVLFPHHLPGSRNRQAITPTRAVLYHAHEKGWREPIRVRCFRAMKSKLHKPVDAKWMQTFLYQCDTDDLHGLAACVLFMNHTAARVSEAINLRGRHVDMRRRTALLVRTKTEVHSTRYLTDELMHRFYGLGLSPDERVFGYTSRYSINERIAAVCRRADIEYRPSHSVGRHSFATNALNLGIGVRTAMDAGGWKSSVVFLETYAHTENAGRMVADRFNRERYAGM